MTYDLSMHHDSPNLHIVILKQNYFSQKKKFNAGDLPFAVAFE